MAKFELETILDLKNIGQIKLLIAMMEFHNMSSHNHEEKKVLKFPINKVYNIYTYILCYSRFIFLTFFTHFAHLGFFCVRFHGCG